MLFFNLYLYASAQSIGLRGYRKYDWTRVVPQLRQHRSAIQRTGKRGPMVDKRELRRIHKANRLLGELLQQHDDHQP